MGNRNSIRRFRLSTVRMHRDSNNIIVTQKDIGKRSFKKSRHGKMEATADTADPAGSTYLLVVDKRRVDFRHYSSEEKIPKSGPAQLILVASVEGSTELIFRRFKGPGNGFETVDTSGSSVAAILRDIKDAHPGLVAKIKNENNMKLRFNERNHWLTLVLKVARGSQPRLAADLCVCDCVCDCDCGADCSGDCTMCNCADCSDCDCTCDCDCGYCDCEMDCSCESDCECANDCSCDCACDCVICECDCDCLCE